MGTTRFFFGEHTGRKRVDDRPTSSPHHHMSEGGVSEHLLVEMNRHKSRNGMGAQTYVSWCVGKDVHGACNVLSRQDIDTSPAARLYLALTVLKGMEPLTTSCLLR